jgi:tetratricopeptide (TPR) repeat protein
MLAYHWSSALELVRASGGDDDEIVQRTRLALRAAGDRAAGLNNHLAAASLYEDALELWPERDAERPDLLFRRARSLYLVGDDRRRDALEWAIDSLLEAGTPEPAAEAEALLAHGAWYEGDRDEAVVHFTKARELVQEHDASPSKVRVLALSARFQMLAGDTEGAIHIAREALELAETLELDELRAHALTTIGSSKSRIELSSGRAKLEEALAIGLAADSPVAATTLNNLAVLAIWEGDFGRGDEIYAESIRISERFGDRDALRFARGNAIFAAYVRGRWDEALEQADKFVAECSTSPHYQEGLVRDARSFIRLGRGDTVGADEDRDVVIEQARRIRDPQRIVSALADSAFCLVLAGRESEARVLARETLALVRENVEMAGAANELLIPGDVLGIRDEFGQLVPLAPEGPWKDVLLASTAGDMTRVADLYASFGMPGHEAFTRMFLGEDLIASGRQVDGAAQLERALAFYRSVGAAFLVTRGEALLARAELG